MKYIKKTILLLACFSFLISISTFKETYAKYKDDINGTTSFNVARWKILVNSQDINSSETSSATITPTFIANENIAQNVIAPTSSGYFDIIIDSTNTDVSFSYTINLEIDEESSVSDIVIDGYKMNNDINNENVEIIAIEDSELTGNILLADTNKVNTIRIYIKWNDDTDTQEMNNAADTEASFSEVPAKINASINFTQLV